MHTGASASFHHNSRSSTERVLPLALGALIPGPGSAGATMANWQPHHGVDAMSVDKAAGIRVARRAIGLADEALGTSGTCDEERRLHAQSTIDLAIFMGRSVPSWDGSIACLPLRSKPLDATACAFASATRSA